MIGEGTDSGPLTVGYYFGAAIMLVGGDASRYGRGDLPGRCSPFDVAQMRADTQE